MKLLEFFSRQPGSDAGQMHDKDKNANFDDDLFWYILDHDKLHKDYFFPIAKKLKNLKECGDGQIFEMFMPMVVKGCKEYYHDRKMEGRLSKKFPVKMREGLCMRLYDHYSDNIRKGKYKLGY